MAAEHNADLIVMSSCGRGIVIVLTSHARQGRARWVNGSTSMKQIMSGQVPVVVVTRESIEQRTVESDTSGS